MGGAATLNGGLFLRNASQFDGGGLYAGTTLDLTGTRFLSNTATSGGGLYHGTGNGRIVNALFADNTASTHNGSGLRLNSTAKVDILHATIANSVLSSGSAIYVTTGTVGITDTIISNYSIGISNTVGIVFENYNLFDGVSTPYLGTHLGGSQSITGSAQFVNPTIDDYHLGFSSAAIDHGINAGISIDLDGNPRPIGLSFDIGAYEYQTARSYVFMPLVLKNY